MPNTKEIDPEILAFIEDHIDLEPNELLAKLKTELGSKCQNANCYCTALNYLKELYCELDKPDIPQKVHDRIMDCLKKKPSL